jgi:hypothetical protein
MLSGNVTVNSVKRSSSTPVSTGRAHGEALRTCRFLIGEREQQHRTVDPATNWSRINNDNEIHVVRFSGSNEEIKANSDGERCFHFG